MPSSFFEKLKKGMGAEGEPILEEETKETAVETKAVKKTRKPKKENKNPQFKVETLSVEPKKSLTIQTETVKKEPKAQEAKKWPSLGGDEEGQLTIDVYQTENDLVIQSAVAGVKPEDLDISIEREIITIRGEREKQSQENGDYFIQECFWGPFSRQVILPVEVDSGRAKAIFKEGVLTIRIPKIQREKKMRINVSA